jgi:hypothetical protein
MNLEDYPLVEYEGRRLRSVPELPGEDTDTWARCTMCVACPNGKRNFKRCQELKNSAGCSVNGVAVIHVPERRFKAYVVELVRRRVSG